MRLYIKTIEHGDTHDIFTWTPAIEGGWNWRVQERAGRFCCWILGWGGITVKSPIEFGKVGVCADFRVEPRPQGGFVVSCEHPLH
jgi:hypothetical protein